MSEKIVCSPGLLWSFNEDLSAGQSCFVEVDVNCEPAVCVSIKLCILVVQGNYFTKTSSRWPQWDCVHWTVFNKLQTSELWMKVSIFNESHSHWGGVVLVTDYIGNDYSVTKFWLDKAWINFICENQECKFASSQFWNIKFGSSCKLSVLLE